MGKAKRIKRAHRELPIPKKHIVLRAGKAFYVFGIGFILLAVILPFRLLSLNNVEISVILVGFFLPCLLGIYFICHFHRWEIEISGNKITERAAWGKIKTYDLEQIESAKVVINPRAGSNTMIVYSKGKRLFFKRVLLRIDTDSYGYEDFCALLRSHNIPIRTV